jgi:DinB superfamily
MGYYSRQLIFKFRQATAMAETFSHISERGSYQQFLKDFDETVRSATVRLYAISAADSNQNGPGEWSRKQILGHLIDSAANNHQRFVRAQSTDDLSFPGYDADEWVDAQKYTDRPWPDLIELWCAYNIHLVHVVSRIPENTLTQPRNKHTLDKIAFHPVDADTPTTLEYLIRDYLDHLKHHLDQILETPCLTPTNN